jgi:pimeloyl-ACP methyl ester carboxylesterase
VRSFKTTDTIKVSGHKIAYLRKGSGETMLLIHGITAYSFIWRNLVDSLSNVYDVICVDLMGCGDSDRPLNFSYSLKQHSKFLNEFIIKLDIKKFHFIGHDVGGGIGQIFAVNYSDKLFSLILINSVGYDCWPVQPILAMRIPIIRQLAMATLDMGVFKLIVNRAVYNKKHVTEELMSYFWKPMKSEKGRKAFLHFAKCLNNKNLMDIAEDLKKITLPVLIIRGDGDIYLDSSICKKLHDEIQGSTLLRIPTGGHFIQEDEPEMIVHHIKTFLSEKVNVC